MLSEVYRHPEDKIESDRSVKDLNKFSGFGGLNGEKNKGKVQRGDPLKLSNCKDLEEENKASKA